MKDIARAWLDQGKSDLGSIKRASKEQILDRLQQYIHLTRLDRPIGIYLLLWPTLWALWIGGQGKPDAFVVLVFMAGVVLMRSAGCAINDFADREIDGKVARTKHRPLASGKITAREALWVTFIIASIALALVSTMNALTIKLAFVGALLAASYPFMKRFHHMPQAHLGTAFGWAVPMAYAAQTGSIDALAWLLFIATVLWTIAYDTMYAMADKVDDIKLGMKSTAILFGSMDRHIIAIFQAFFIFTMLIIGQRAELGSYYFASVLIAALLMAYQQSLIKKRRPKACTAAFLHNHWVGLVIFAGIIMDGLV